jgi:hypothetical protein
MAHRALKAQTFPRRLMAHCVLKAHTFPRALHVVKLAELLDLLPCLMSLISRSVFSAIARRNEGLGAAPLRVLLVGAKRQGDLCLPKP